MNAPLNLAFVGHVDHGKSTLIASLLVALGAISERKIAALRDRCESQGRAFELAFLLDVFEEERNHGITIDGVRLRIETADGTVLRIFDCPGHLEFLRNMLTGASQADAAVILLDASEGIQENSRRHALLLAFLGVRQVIVAVNKMDLLGHSQKAFEDLRASFSEILAGYGDLDARFVPVAASRAENVAAPAASMPWWQGPTLLQAIRDLAREEAALEKAALRFQVQDVYLRKTVEGYERILAGVCHAGTLRAGDRLRFLPTGHSSAVAQIEEFPARGSDEILPGRQGAFRIADRRHVLRGEIAVREDDESVAVSHRWRARLVWLAPASLREGEEYLFKMGTFRARCRIAKILRRIDSSTSVDGGSAATVERNELAEVVLETESPLAADLKSAGRTLSRFVLVHQFEISGAGFLSALEPYEERKSRYHPAIQRVDREQRNKHRARLILLPEIDSDDQSFALEATERSLFAQGHQVAVVADRNEATAVTLLEHGFVVLFPGRPLSTQEKESLQRRIGDVPIEEMDALSGRNPSRPQ